MKLRWSRKLRKERDWHVIPLERGQASKENVAAVKTWANAEARGDWMLFVVSYSGYAVFAFSDPRDAVIGRMTFVS